MMQNYSKVLVTLALTTLIGAGCVSDDDGPVQSFVPESMNNGEGSNENNANNTRLNNENSESNNEPQENNEAPNNSVPHSGVPIPAWVGGSSVDGRAMVVEHYGESGPVLFILSAIHGTERLSVTYGERFRAELTSGFARRHGIQVVYLQSANPDGVSRYERFNSRDVDLNRNFDTDNFSPGGVGGDSPLSEPEAVAIKGIVDASGLTAAISVHCCAPTFDNDGPGLELAHTMSEAMDPAYRFEAAELGAAPGSLGSYVGLELGLPIITVEFARTEDMEPFGQLEEMDHAFDAAGAWVSDNPGGGVLDFDAFPKLDDHPFEAWFSGTSSGELPLRSERVGPSQAQGRPNVLLSGFDGTHQRGVWIAEHIRRELLAWPGMEDHTWLMHTAVHPDAMADGSVDPTPVRDAIAGGDEGVAEAAAVLDLLADPARVFLVDNSTDGNECVEVYGDEFQTLSGQIPQDFRCGSADDSLALALADQGHSVIRMAVDTETAEAQLRGLGTNTEFDTTIPSPVDYSDLVFELAGML